MSLCLNVCIIFVLFRGVLETLIRHHFPTPVSALASIDWSLMDNDVTFLKAAERESGPLLIPV